MKMKKSLTLIWVGGLILLFLSWFSFNNSETIIAVTLAFDSIQQHFIRDIFVIFGIPNSPQSPYIGENSDGGISNFWISGQSFINENCYNSRTSHDTDMKLGPVTKLDKKNTATSKKYEDNIMSVNCDFIILYFFQFMANFQPSGSRIPGALSKKFTFSLIITF